MSDCEPYTLSDFTILKKLGEGGFGSAHLARRNSDGKEVCLKFLPFCGRLYQRRALHEAEILSHLKYPNIIEYYGSFVDGDSFCIVMEYAPNGSLRDLIVV